MDFAALFLIALEPKNPICLLTPEVKQAMAKSFPAQGHQPNLRFLAFLLKKQSIANRKIPKIVNRF